jgi:hypothetical protein
MLCRSIWEKLVKPDPHLRILPWRNIVTQQRIPLALRGSGAVETTRNSGERAARLFAAPARPHLLQWRNATSFDVHWKTDSSVNRARREQNRNECYSNNVHTCACAVTLQQNTQVWTRMKYAVPVFSSLPPWERKWRCLDIVEYKDVIMSCMLLFY